jgi:hypothetical protein
MKHMRHVGAALGAALLRFGSAQAAAPMKT